MNFVSFGLTTSEFFFLEIGQSEAKLPVVAMFMTDWGEMSNRYRGPSIDASSQVSFHLALQFQRRFFRNRPIRNKNSLCRPCLLTNRDEMSKIYREPSIDASYQIFSSFGITVSEEKIKMWKVNGRQKTDDGCQVMAKAHIAFGKAS